MTPRGTDWSLALAVAAAAATGLLTIFAGTPGRGWVFAAHGTLGFAVGAVLVWKLRRVGPRLRHPSRWDARTGLGLAALVLVAGTLALGLAWSTGVEARVAGYNLLAVHDAAGAVLALAVLAHMAGRAKRPRRRDLADRRQLLTGAAVFGGALAVWALQRPVQRAVGARGGQRRFTGSYERGSFEGNAFPTTSWVADDPRALDAGDYRLRIGGLVRRPRRLALNDLDRGDELVATLDCTGGFYSTQRWRGARLGDVIADSRPAPSATHVRVVSVTGYRWGFSLEDARDMLLATHVGDEPLSHGHGAPVRLVAPGRRGFQWVKWVTALELHDGPDPGAIVTTVTSSFRRA
jgi:DMSO/TMAO reductase YedYZ molybdopterin-dependent catalytic subunit